MSARNSLILKRAATSRPSGEWNDDDYDVLADGAVVGRIMHVGAGAPEHAPVANTRLYAATKIANRRTSFTSVSANKGWPNSILNCLYRGLKKAEEPIVCETCRKSTFNLASL